MNATTPFLPVDSDGLTRVRPVLSSGRAQRFLCRSAIDLGAPVSEWHSGAGPESTAFEDLTKSGRWAHLVLAVREG